MNVRGGRTSSQLIPQRPLARLVGGELAKMTCSSWQIATSCLELPKSGYFLGQGHTGIRETATPNFKFPNEGTRQHNVEQGPKKIRTYYNTSFLEASYIVSQSMRLLVLAKAYRPHCAAPKDLGANTSSRRRRDLQFSASKLSNPWNNGEIAVKLLGAQQGIVLSPNHNTPCSPSTTNM